MGDQSVIDTGGRTRGRLPSRALDRNQGAARRLTISVEQGVADLLVQTALGLDLKPMALARRLIESGLKSDASRLMEIDGLSRDMRIANLELRDLSARMSKHESECIHGNMLGRDRPSRRRQSEASRPPRARLHEEIVAVLRESGRPLTSAEIAARIRQRARFEPPRSKRGVDVLMVASRISHEGYRHLFWRDGRKVHLAPDLGEDGGTDGRQRLLAAPSTRTRSAGPMDRGKATTH